jgi:hypothetical protein
MKKIHFMLTAFRDGFQSVFGARVFSKDYLPVVEFAAEECGITHMEAGGGALFQSPFFYSNENAFDVMDAFRCAVGPKVELQTLARGINVVALKAQPRDLVKLHADLFKKHGMTTIRNFDALNDVSNLIWSGQCIKDAGLRHEVTVTLMELPPVARAHTMPPFTKTPCVASSMREFRMIQSRSRTPPAPPVRKRFLRRSSAPASSLATRPASRFIRMTRPERACWLTKLPSKRVPTRLTFPSRRSQVGPASPT